MPSVVRNKTIPYIGARWCRRLSYILRAETMGATGTLEEFERLVQAEKKMGRRRARRS
jgi:hypothetical protein